MDVGDNIGGGCVGRLDGAAGRGAAARDQPLPPDALRPGGRRGLRRGRRRRRGHARRRRQDRRPPRRPGRRSPARSACSSTAATRTRPDPRRLRFFDGGTTAVLETTDEHTLVLTQRAGRQHQPRADVRGRSPAGDPQVVVAKGVVSPRPAYSPIAAEIILVNTPGVTTRRPVALHLPPAPPAALPVRARRPVSGVESLRTAGHGSEAARGAGAGPRGIPSARIFPSGSASPSGSG